MTILEALKVLEMPTPFTKIELRSGYRNALMVWHPDRFPENTELLLKANRKTQEINEAFTLLSDAIGNDESYPCARSSESKTEPKRTTAPPTSEQSTTTRDVPQSHRRGGVNTPPAPLKARRVASKFVAIFSILVFALIYFGQKLVMGTKYKVSDKESVNYSGKATETDAKSLGDALKANGYMSGKNAVDVLLKKDDKEGTVVSFVGEWDWKAENVVSAFQQIGEDIAVKGLGKPLTIRLLDTKLNTKNEIKVP